MDDIVLKAMTRWPNVPAVYGWLSLDQRGRWCIKDEAIGNPVISAFIGRNYAADARQCWFFQNGPQQVFVDLDYTPWVYRFWCADGSEQPVIESHTGAKVEQPTACWLDDAGNALLETEFGIGVIEGTSLQAWLACLRDRTGNPLSATALERIIEAGAPSEPQAFLVVKQRQLALGRLKKADVPRRFAYVQRPSQIAMQHEVEVEANNTTDV
jgi:hypothetical protein